MHFIELISRAQKGDIRAYGELVSRFQGMAFGYAYSLLRDFHLAQDATQEAFLEGWRHVGSIRDARAWPVWLRRVVFKHCDRLRRRKQLATLIAATVGDLDRVREVLKADASQANALSPCYRRPLSAAARKGYVEIVQVLLKHGADPNAKEALCQGGLSLRAAAGKGYIDIARLLLEHGAVPGHWVDASGDALYAAHSGGHKEILQLLYAHGGTMELRVYAAAHRIDVIAEVLRLQPSRADDVLPYGWDSADKARTRSLPRDNEDLAYDIMRLAIRYGARFENASAWNMRWTVAQYPRVFKLLCEHGANPDKPLLGISGDMPRRWPDADHQLRTISFLVEDCGANVNCQNEEGFTPLSLAARVGYAHLVDYLLSRGANPNPDAPEWTKPLYLAQKHGHVHIAEMLHRHGAQA